MQDKNKKPLRCLIIGGGTAGWMSALMLQSAIKRPVDLTLIESKTIGTIGVGEGTTPYIRAFFDLVNINEEEWMPACNATYKCGIRFPNWSTKAGYQSYYHPFFSSHDIKYGDEFFHLANERRRGNDVAANPDHYFLAHYLSSRGKSPVLPENSQHTLDYAYHFDAGKLGEYMRNVAIQRGVKHKYGLVKHVKQDEQGCIDAIITDENEELHADFFIDCSGFAGILIEKTLKTPFVSFADNLLNDAAVAIQTPIDESQTTPTETRSEALQHGWMWQIPLRSRQGNGYVYSQSHCTPEDAEKALRKQLNVGDNIAARHIKMRVGRRQSHLVKNCMAIGLSQGFIEPLEATALMLVQFSLLHFIDYVNVHQHHHIDNHIHINQVNSAINHMIDGIRDYIVAHYKTNSRQDSEYWRINREETPVSSTLDDILNAWRSGQSLEAVLDTHASQLAYMRPSWYCMLAGTGYFSTSMETNAKPSVLNDASAYYSTLADTFNR